MWAGTDHPAFMTALEGCHGPSQPPEQNAHTSASQAAASSCAHTWAGCRRTAPKPGCLSAPHVWHVLTQGCDRTCSLGRQISASYLSDRCVWTLNSSTLVLCPPRSLRHQAVTPSPAEPLCSFPAEPCCPPAAAGQPAGVTTVKSELIISNTSPPWLMKSC